MAFSAFSPLPFPVSLGFRRPQSPTTAFPRLSFPVSASLSSSSSESKSAKSSSPTDNLVSSSNGTTPPSFVEPSTPPDSNFPYAFPNPTPAASASLHPILGFMQSTESSIERVILLFPFLFQLGFFFFMLLSFPVEAQSLYWLSNVLRNRHIKKTIENDTEIYVFTDIASPTFTDVYLAGTVMLIFGMGLYGLFISNVSPDEPPLVDRALKGSSLFGMFALKERPKWMKISSLDELKTKVGHVIVMILLVKMFERSKMVTIATGLDLLSYSVCIFLSSASLYILHNLHRPE
ncbi:putative Structural constituent of ribosome [Cucumis melo var. makuwa]|uniref:Structural constituent of ribosome n=1 Tax=Cucumis melo var. makuwa TaxID=1194695 RepID=A0A5D3BL65_CUCMM|nr:putative Structural constituent of ribosome [Cucumis melo var. makuwa]TYJ99867.1 putative Structural constituent of ribosome [Cucumis melo var. makuwa]